MSSFLIVQIIQVLVFSPILALIIAVILQERANNQESK